MLSNVESTLFDGVLNLIAEKGAGIIKDNLPTVGDYLCAQIFDSFEKGHIRYLNEDLQKKTEESIAQAKREAIQKAEEARIAAENKKQAQKGQAAKKPVSNTGITFESVKLMLEPAQYSLNSVAKSGEYSFDLSYEL